MSFGTWLYQSRKKAGLTQTELAKKAGISANYVSALEREEPNTRDGQPRQPRPDKVDRIARALGVAIDEARQAAGYLPNKLSETFEILDGARVSFDERKFTKKEQEQLIEMMRTLALGVKAQQEKDEKK